MKQPELRETTDRSEMMCPRCEKEGLEENPAYADEYSGRSAILKSTRCPNEECEYNYGVPEDEISVQMPDKKYGEGLSNILPSELTVSSAIRIFIFILGIIFMLSQFGLLPFGSDTSETPDEEVLSNVSGELTGENVSELSDVELLLQSETKDESYSTNPNNNNFSFNDIKTGKYKLYLSSSDLNVNPSGKQINVTKSGIDNVSIDINDSEVYKLNQTVENALIDIDYKNPNNVEDINLTLSPIAGDNIEREHEIKSGTEKTILMPIKPQSEQIRVDSKETTKEQIKNLQYIDDEESYNISGNMDAESMDIELTNESTSEVQSETIDVTESGLKENISISSNETVGNVTLNLRDGTSQERQQMTGEWTGEESIEFMTGVKDSTTANLQVSPSPETSSRNITDTINQNTIEPDFGGNMPIDDAVIKFNGGDSSSDEIGDKSITANAENGSTGEIVEELGTVEESGTYRIDWDAEIINNENLVNFSYSVNGDKISIEEGSDGEGLSLEKNDTVEIIAESERQTVSDDENSPSFDSLDDDLNIVNMSFEPSNPEPGDTVEFYATIENKGSNEVTDEFQFYLNGDEEASKSYTIPANSQKEIGGISDLGSSAVSEEGTNVWFINDRGPFFLEVGDSEPVYGNAELSATLSDLSAEGEVSVDTNNDGDTDCTVLARNGECEFDTYDFEPNNQENIRIGESGVSNTEYTISYTEQTNPEDIDIDMRENNITDYSYEGILTESDSNTVEIPEGNTSMGINVDNNIPLEYSLTWDAEAVIDNPVIYVNGDEVIGGLDNFQEKKSFDIGPLSKGDNEFEFLASSGGYTVDIEWIEDEGQSYPSTYINNNQVCDSGGSYANNLTCTNTEQGLSPGEHTIDFDSSNSFNYQLSYDTRAISNSVDIDVDGNQKTFYRESTNPQEWTDVSTTSLLERGENNVSVTVPDENGMTPNSTAKIQYSIDTGDVENPELIVTNGDNETNTVDIPESALDSNLLTEDVDVQIPENWLTTNNNQIEIKTDNGVFELRGNIKVSDENIKFGAN